MRDILPDEVELRDAAVREIVGIYRAYGFRRIETPALESLRLLEGIARHCGFPEASHGAFFIAFDKLDRLGADGLVAELREGGHDAQAVGRFAELLPGLSPDKVSLEALRAALPGAGATDAWDPLATIIETTNGEVAAGCRVRFDPTLVRGMGYYTGPI